MNEQRTIFDWTIFALIHIVLIGGICVAGFYVYGFGVGFWVAASATIAGLALTYLFGRNVPGETLMKIILYLFAALNAGYIVHNGARAIGVEAFNNAQVQKFEKGIAAAAQSKSGRVAGALGASAKDASKIEKLFGDEVALLASVFAFLELFTALVALSLASRRKRESTPARNGDFNHVETAENFARPKEL